MPRRPGATLAAYAVGLIPFVTIRSAVATFYARKDTATPVKASLTGLTVNVLLKVLLMGSLAQVGLALATAVGAWINLLLVLGFAVRAGYLDLDKALMRSLAKFVVCGVVRRSGTLACSQICGDRVRAIERVSRRDHAGIADRGRRLCLWFRDPAAVRQGMDVFAGPRSATAARQSSRQKRKLRCAAKAVCASARSAAICRKIGHSQSEIRWLPSNSASVKASCARKTMR